MGIGTELGCVKGWLLAVVVLPISYPFPKLDPVSWVQSCTSQRASADLSSSIEEAEAYPKVQDRMFPYLESFLTPEDTACAPLVELHTWVDYIGLG